MGMGPVEVIAVGFPGSQFNGAILPELQKLVASMHEEKRRPIRTVLQLAQLRGEIGHDIDLEIALSMLIGPFVLKRMIDREEVTPEFREAVIRTAVAGLRAMAELEQLAPVSTGS